MHTIQLVAIQYIFANKKIIGYLLEYLLGNCAFQIDSQINQDHAEIIHARRDLPICTIVSN